MQPAMPLVLSAVVSVLGVGVWQFFKRESWRLTPSGMLDGIVKALGLCAVLIGVLSIVFMLLGS